MHKRLRKTAALILTAALLLQNQIPGMAEEAQTETVTEAAMEESQNQSAAEETQSQNAAEETQSQNAAEETQSQTAAEGTQSQTAAETSQTQAAAEETQSQTAAEETSQTQEADTQDETEQEEAVRLSDRKNTGKKVTADDLVSKLEDALPYLFVAESTDASEDLLDGQAILQENGARSVLDELSGQSVELSDARSSGDVKVINIYADEDGNLDEAQLDALFEDQVIDVTDQYYLVNVIAASADQELEFSGYEMKLSGNIVQYSEETQPGDILYNFAALDGDALIGYEGTLTLNNGDGLQGTFLAPGADVRVKSALAGSVFAENIEVADTVESLLQIGFIDGIPEVEQETDSSQSAGADEGLVLNESAGLGNSADQSITLSVAASYNGTTLTAADAYDSGKYVALFAVNSDNTTGSMMSGVLQLSFSQDQSVALAQFESLAEGTYRILQVDSGGTILTTDTELQLPADDFTITTGSSGISTSGTLSFSAYPEGEFSYPVTITLTKKVLDTSGAALISNATFYAGLYTDSTLTSPVSGSPVFTFTLADSSETVATYTGKLTSASATYYLAETDANGSIVSSGSSFGYNISLSQSSLTLSCAAASVSATITNQVWSDDPTVIRLGATDSSDGTYLSGITLLIKDSQGKLVLSKTFTSGTSILQLSDADVQQLTTGETYYLSEVTAPSGYAPAQDVAFTVAANQTTDVVLAHTEAKTTNYQITATKQVYVGSNQVYANGTSSNHSFYVALFADSDHIVKVSNVQKVTVNGLSGSTVFENLTKNTTYYIAETNANGIPKSSSSSLTIQYENSGKVKTSSKSSSTTVKNVYSSLPSGYRYTAVLILTKKVVDSSGTAEATDGTFYVGIYRKSDYSDTPTIVTLELDGKSSASVKRRILLPGKTDSSYSSVTYYIAEVDADGNRLTSSSDFDYNISISSAEVTLGKSDSKTVTVTNEKKISSKVTLYLTKRVYEGSTATKVTETFYAGLFKDSSFTQLYTNPIPLSLTDKSALTLKLSLNLGQATEATIYVAEVDADGNVITDQQSFGYEIKMVNSTAAFTAQTREIHTVLLNSVYGTSTDDDWESIISDNDWGDYSAVSENGEASEGTASPETGDTVPFGWYMLLMAAAFAAFTGAFLLRRRR